MTNIPCACDLHAFSSEQRAEHQALLEELRARVAFSEERPGGVALNLPGDDDTVGRVMSFMLLERRCCPFLSFGLELGPGDEPLTLSLHGDANAREVIRAELGW